MLTRIEARNFKCFDHLDLELAALNVLVGINGSGKSTVTQLFGLLRQSWDHGSTMLFPLTLNGPYVQLGFGEDVLYEGADGSEGLSITIDASDGGATWRFEYDARGDVLALAADSPTESVRNLAVFTDRFQAISASRLGPQRSYERPDYEVRSRRRLGASGEYWAHYLRVYGQEKVTHPLLLHPEAEGPTLSSQVDAWLGEISPGVRVSVEEAGNSGLITSGFAFETPIGLSRSFSGPNVGFGLSYLLPVLIALLDSDAASLLVLENPEAHLHPEGQLVIGRLLGAAAAGGAQIIVETHSDHVINGVRLAVSHGLLAPESARLYFFARDREADYPTPGIVPVRVGRDGSMEPRPAGFFDQWERSLRHLLVAKGASDAGATRA